ncbi:hypothetical protein ACHAW6_004633 [Cyclotella cf. meneghiniana]
MWPSHAHILKPLADHSGLKKQAPIPWTLDIQTALNKMHMLMAADTLAVYPDHNKFDVLVLYKKADQLPIFPETVEVTAKLYGNGKGNAIHHSYTQ